MKYYLLIPVFFFFLLVSAGHVPAADDVNLSTDCDKALHIFWKGRLSSDIDQANQYFQESIKLGSNTIRVEAADTLGNRAHISIEIEGEFLFFVKTGN